MLLRRDKQLPWTWWLAMITSGLAATILSYVSPFDITLAWLLPAGITCVATAITLYLLSLVDWRL